MFSVIGVVAFRGNYRFFMVAAIVTNGRSVQSFCLAGNHEAAIQLVAQLLGTAYWNLLHSISIHRPRTLSILIAS